MNSLILLNKNPDLKVQIKMIRFFEKNPIPLKINIGMKDLKVLIKNNLKIKFNKKKLKKMKNQK